MRLLSTGKSFFWAFDLLFGFQLFCWGTALQRSWPQAAARFETQKQKSKLRYTYACVRIKNIVFLDCFQCHLNPAQVLGPGPGPALEVLDPDQTRTGLRPWSPSRPVAAQALRPQSWTLAQTLGPKPDPAPGLDLPPDQARPWALVSVPTVSFFVFFVFFVFLYFLYYP